MSAWQIVSGCVRPHRVVLLDDPDYRPDEGGLMQFRLTYQGPLYATQKDPVTNQRDARAEHKHALRQVFHKQLKRLWDITPSLKAGGGTGPQGMVWDDERPPVNDAASLAAKHSLYGWNFVPLVTQELNLICGLDILFLRPDHPGSVVYSGDIDNRLKTLFDSLSIPTANERYIDKKAKQDECPFYCLLEQDKFITKISVETDQLLEYVGNQPNPSDVRLVITVTLRPYEMHFENLHFG
jgi:hypothetical protein